MIFYIKSQYRPPAGMAKILLVMKLIVILLTTAILQVSASSFAQKLTYTKKGATLEQIFTEIQKQTGYFVVYAEDKVDKHVKLDVNFKGTDLKDVLEVIAKSQDLTYSMNENNIGLKPKAPSLLDKLSTVISNIVTDLTVKGRVVDQEGKPLPNASIRVKGKSAVTNTNQNGEFEIKGVNEDAVLLVSYVGFKTLEIALKDAVMPLEIKLNVATGELEEVKVVYNTGYQELNRERSTGSFVQIDNELFNRAVGANVLDRILNVTSGLIANPLGNSTFGNAGIGSGFGTGGNQIVIRGTSTINANPAPLIIVDNFPYGGDLKNLNPNDVESITVLKDAAAASIWGVRAGNGVIVITTKNGKFNQATNIGIVSNVTMGQKPDLSYIPYISSRNMIEIEKIQFGKGFYDVNDDLYPSINIFFAVPQSVEILLEARRKNKNTIGYNALNDPVVNAELEELGKHDLRDDINKYLIQRGINQQYALNLSGGGGNFNYYASVGYDQNRNFDVGAKNNRLSINFNNTWKPIRNIEINTSIVHVRSKNIDAGSNYSNLLPSSSAQISPYTKLADEQGNSLAIPKTYRIAYVDTVSYPALLDWHYYPIDNNKYLDNSTQNYDTRVSAILKYTIQPWLNAEFQYQNQTSQSNARNYRQQESFEVRDVINRFMSKDASGRIVYPYPLGDVADLSNSTFKAWNLRGSLRFNQKFENHHISAFIGMELRETNNDVNNNTLYGVDRNTTLSIPVSLTQSFPMRPSGTGVIGLLKQPSGNLTRNGSFFGTAEYNYKGKYLLTSSGRIDQSNFFGVKANLRKVPLWSVGLAWNVHLEDFYKLEWLSLLKFKTSYGYTGNTNSGASSYATFIYRTGNEGVPARNIRYGNIISPSNPQLQWERVKTINTGVEFALKGGILSGEIEVYQKKGMDLLGPIVLEPTNGISRFTGNQASVQSKGIDISFRTQNILKGFFQWNTNLMIGFNKDKVIAYAVPPPAASSMAISSGISVGDPRYSLYSYRFAGLDPKNGDPRIYLSDTISSYSNYYNADKEDLILHGSTNPKISGSLLNILKYKRVSVSANIIYQFGHYFRRSSVDYTQLLNTGWIGHSDFESRWHRTGDELVTNVPSLPAAADGTRDNAYLYSDALVEKADHVRLYDLRAEYSLDKKVFKKLPFKQVSFYVYAKNLGILWRANKKGIDPVAYGFGYLPDTKTISFGINANL